MRHPDDAGHVAVCPDCQARASLRGLDVDLEKVWAGVAAEVSPELPSASPERPVESPLGRLVRSGLARVRAVPSPVLSLILVIAAVSAVAAIATPTTGGPLLSLVTLPPLASDLPPGSYAQQQAQAGRCSPSATPKPSGSRLPEKPAYTPEPPPYQDPWQSYRPDPPAPSYYGGWWPRPANYAPADSGCPVDGLPEQAAVSDRNSPGLLR